VQVSPVLVELKASSGSTGTFEVSLEAEPIGVVNVALQDSSGTLAFFPDILAFPAGAAGSLPQPVTVISVKVGCSGLASRHLGRILM
jgi:hypothetical protein